MASLTYPKPPAQWTEQALAQRIDLTRLVFPPQEDRQTTLEGLCHSAKDHQFRAVCVRPEDIALVKQCLGHTSVKIATVIAFPPQPLSLAEAQQIGVGNAPLPQKQAEITQALALGATELDVVITTAAVKGLDAGLAEMSALVSWAQDIPIKLILETDLLTPSEVEHAVIAAGRAGIAMVKTSTGMVQGGLGATVEVIRKMRTVITTHHFSMGIKASGGIRTLDKAIALLNAGADILGASAGVEMLAALKTAPTKH